MDPSGPAAGPNGGPPAAPAAAPPVSSTPPLCITREDVSASQELSEGCEDAYTLEELPSRGTPPAKEARAKDGILHPCGSDGAKVEAEAEADDGATK